MVTDMADERVPPEPKPPRFDWWGPAMSVLGIAVLSFVAGSVLMLTDREPAASVARSFQAGQALVDKMTAYRDPLTTDLWRDAPTRQRGVTSYDEGRAQGGMTLYTSGDKQEALLIDMRGRVVHRWEMPFSVLWDKSAAVKKPQADPYVYIEKAQVLPNGDLLALYVAVGDTPWGYGLAKIDRNGRVIWKYLGHAHHDFDVAEDGTVWVLTQEVGTKPTPPYTHLKPPRIDDYAVQLSPDGRELRKVSLLDAIMASPFSRILNLVPAYAIGGKGDYLHTNTIEEIRTGPPLPRGVAPGQLLLSFREINTVATLDAQSGKIAWVMPGPWMRQHDPDMLPNGNILMFDNEGEYTTKGVSRAIEVDPATGGVVWSYAGTPERPLLSIVRSSVQRLANGNTMIVESDAGRILEVTAEGALAWEYQNPVRGGPQDRRIPIIFWATRVDPSTFEPAFRQSLQPVS